MSPSAILESAPRMTFPGTPPELVSPTATSFSSGSSPSADHVWASQALASLPMSNHDKAIGRNDGHWRRETTPPIGPNSQTQRQQLPSLSSLFGPPASMRPLSSSILCPPLHNPLHSPLDRPRTCTEGSPDSSSYFPSTTALPVNTYEPPWNSTMLPSTGSRPPASAEIKSQLETELRWIPPLTGRREHMLGSQYNFRPHHPESNDIAMEYRENSISSSSYGGGGTAPEGSIFKDGLGRKIWNGTHFLPRFVRAAEVPGEGMCYFYDDGTHCKTIIDGEAVTAHWGVTKAGKPRKRLAIACMTCREKKIKCDPDYPRCVQCVKYGRTCRFKNAPRGGQASSPMASFAEPHNGKTMSSPCGSKSPGVLSARAGKKLTHRMPEDVLHRAWHTNVYLSDPESICGVITQFFLDVDSTMLLKFLPEDACKHHLLCADERQRPEDLMILYSILAIGVALSGGPKPIAFDYAQVAQYAQKSLDFNCLQLVQARILLAAYFISIDRIHDASELLSSATAVSASLQLNVELEKSAEASMTAYPFGMTKDGYKESRRRTLWSLFMLERLNGIFPNRPAMINPEDLYIRLPTDNQNFERQTEEEEPVFDPYSLMASARTVSRGVLSNLVEMTQLWADCQSVLYRIACRPAAASAESTRIQSLGKRIRSWYSCLPEHLSFCPNNLEDSAHFGSAGSFLSMHILYHHAMIKVNRHHSAATLLGPELQSSYAHNCFGHATGILDIIHTFDSLRHGKPSLRMLPRIIATAAVEAVDALTANGSMSSISEQINYVREALMAVESLSNTWEDVNSARVAISNRMDKLLDIREQGTRSGTPVQGSRALETGDSGRWQICEPIDKLLPREMDIVYSIPL